MRKTILITGLHSYIGTSFEIWMKKKDSGYHIDKISLRNDAWKKQDFSKYDTILHTAGIAHADAKGKEEALYNKINRDLTIRVAEKAKNEGVSQFIFLSSIIVYGETNSIKIPQVITKQTIPIPSNHYGKSKLEAEKGLIKLESENFKVAIVRAPMIYGSGSKGNYKKLGKLAQVTPIFPQVDNQRSMLYIDNLCEFLKLLAEKEKRGIYFPQNAEYVNTTTLVQEIAAYYQKKIYLVKHITPLLYYFGKIYNPAQKLFGSLIYEKSLSEYGDISYQLISFHKSVVQTETGNKKERISCNKIE